MSISLIVIFILIGLLLLVLEVLVIPGSTVVGIIGFAAMVFAIWQAYAVHGSLTGHLTLGATLVSAVFVLYYVLKARTWNRLMLKDKIEGKMNVLEDDRLHPGDEGLTISRLNPAGKAMFGKEIFEVHTVGDFIEEKTWVVIIKIEGSRVLVRRKEA